MGQCNKKPTPPLFSDEQLAELRKEHAVFTCEEDEGLTIKTRVYSKQPSKEALIRARIAYFEKTVFEDKNHGIYTDKSQLMQQEIHFLKLLL